MVRIASSSNRCKLHSGNSILYEYKGYSHHFHVVMRVSLDIYCKPIELKPEGKQKRLGFVYCYT